MESVKVLKNRTTIRPFLLCSQWHTERKFLPSKLFSSYFSVFFNKFSRKSAEITSLMNILHKTNEVSVRNWFIAIDFWYYFRTYTATCFDTHKTIQFNETFETATHIIAWLMWIICWISSKIDAFLRFVDFFAAIRNLQCDLCTFRMFTEPNPTFVRPLYCGASIWCENIEHFEILFDGCVGFRVHVTRK